jgi:hypothetical protein
MIFPTLDYEVYYETRKRELKRRLQQSCTVIFFSEIRGRKPGCTFSENKKKEGHGDTQVRREQDCIDTSRIE